MFHFFVIKTLDYGDMWKNVHTGAVNVQALSPMYVIPLRCHS
jgi:hypothetical protein